MTAPTNNNPIQNPYTRQPLQITELKVQTKETEWFEAQIKKLDEKGIDTKDMKQVLETAQQHNKDLYARKIDEDKAEADRRGCAQQ